MAYEGRRTVTLTSEQAEIFWQPVIEQRSFDNFMAGILESGERIVGIGSNGSSEPKDQTVLYIEKQ